MPQFGLPARLMLFGRPQTPALEAVLALLPREEALARLRVGLAPV
jgi:glutamyl-tRNA synthetase